MRRHRTDRSGLKHSFPHARWATDPRTRTRPTLRVFPGVSSPLKYSAENAEGRRPAIQPTLVRSAQYAGKPLEVETDGEGRVMGAEAKRRDGEVSFHRTKNWLTRMDPRPNRCSFPSFLSRLRRGSR